MKDFVAIDFETANGRRSSICSVGVVIVRDGNPCGRGGLCMDSNDIIIECYVIYKRLEYSSAQNAIREL